MIKPGETPPTIDCYAALLDLPQLLHTTLETIPSYNSYLSAPSDLQKEWANRLGPRKTFRLGIVWAGRSEHKNDRNRSIEAFLFQPLTKIRGVSVYSLQVGRNGEATKIFADTVTDIAPFLNDFADTAAAVSNLDLVVSVDTSVAHIAGALGWPIWTLIPFVPDWRWLLERDDSPWYPSLHLCRQSKLGQWDSAIEKVATWLDNKNNTKKPNNEDMIAPAKIPRKGFSKLVKILLNAGSDRRGFIVSDITFIP